ncbi:hypothetical protein [Sporosarcina aquimarina]|uniref:hypothetical protein n=1 Tax=Sporosarcina aquimarina TaxID=114975 RepID=UPI001C8F090C|nr:hypothetical protein [Sporosarcina aquimarina]MBY0222325.1 hypothetical protein [Sporosarcina aquimarina]
MKPKIHKGRPIIQPGETYDIDGKLNEVVTGVAGNGKVRGDSISLSQLVYILEDVQTGERMQIGEKELHAKLS